MLSREIHFELSSVVLARRTNDFIELSEVHCR